MDGPYHQEWKIDNFSCWSQEVHGECIESPPFFFSYFTKMILYPKHDGDRLMLHFRTDSRYRFCGEVCFMVSDGSPYAAWTYPVDTDQGSPTTLEGPTFEEVMKCFERIGAKDYLTLQFNQMTGNDFEQSMCTIIDVLKVSFDIDQEFLSKFEVGGCKKISFIPYSQAKDLQGLFFKATEKSKRIHFTLEAPNWENNAKPILVKSCANVLSEDGTLMRCEKKNHLFKCKSQWTFSDSMPVKVNGTKLMISFKIVNGNVKNSYNHFVYQLDGVDLVRNDCVCSLNNEPENLNASKLEGPCAVLSQELMAVYQDQDFSDFKLICEKVSFPVHKIILSARSPVFKCMFLNPMKEATADSLVIEDMEAPTLSRFLTFLYSGTVADMYWENAIQLYYAADKYDVPTLKKRCVKVLVADISIENVCDILSLAHKHVDGELTWVAQDFILNNYNQVCRSEGWQSFMKTDPSLLLETVTRFAAENFIKKPE